MADGGVGFPEGNGETDASPGHAQLDRVAWQGFLKELRSLPRDRWERRSDGSWETDEGRIAIGVRPPAQGTKGKEAWLRCGEVRLTAEALGTSCCDIIRGLHLSLEGPPRFDPGPQQEKAPFSVHSALPFLIIGLQGAVVVLLTVIGLVVVMTKILPGEAMALFGGIGFLIDGAIGLFAAGYALWRLLNRDHSTNQKTLLLAGMLLQGAFGLFMCKVTIELVSGKRSF